MGGKINESNTVLTPHKKYVKDPCTATTTTTTTITTTTTTTTTTYSFKYNQQDAFCNILYYCLCSTSVIPIRGSAVPWGTANTS